MNDDTFDFSDIFEQSASDTLRAALRSTTGDPELDQFARMSLLQSFDNTDDALLDVWYEEAGPEQAEMDLHLHGAKEEDHTTDAWGFGNFVTSVAEAVKETAKSLAGERRRARTLQVEGASPGSVRVVFRVPPLDHKPQSDIEETANVDSRALRRIGSLFSTASTLDDDETVDGDLSGFPASARQALSKAVKQLRSNGITLDGSVYQRRIGLERVSLSRDGAERLSRALRRRLEDEDDVVLIGKIDGQQRSRGVMWLVPDSGGSAIKAAVLDPDLMDEVAALGLHQDQRVKCTFHVVRSYAEGTTSGGRVSRRLDRIQPVYETGTLFEF